MTPKEHEINLKSHELWAERGNGMFDTPIKRSPITSMAELIKFSYQTDSKGEREFVYWQKNGQIAFVDYFKTVWVTPYRSEVSQLLKEAEYTEESGSVPFSRSEQIPEAYRWLMKIAEEENWAMTHEEAFKKATERGIKPVYPRQKLQIKGIIGKYEDEESNKIYLPMMRKFFENGTEENIATYIVVDEKTLLICDEYGRTFLVKAKTVVNDLVNSLLEAGYTRTVNPEQYVRFREKND